MKGIDEVFEKQSIATIKKQGQQKWKTRPPLESETNGCWRSIWHCIPPLNLQAQSR